MNYIFFSSVMSMSIIESANSKGLNPRDDDSLDLGWGLGMPVQEDEVRA